MMEKILQFLEAPFVRSNWSLELLENLDTSEYNFPNTLWHRKPASEIALKCTIMMLIGLTGIYLNGVILHIIAKNKWLWTASNFLVGNLALVDLVTLLICPWFWLTRDFYQSYVLGQFGCRFEAFVQGTFLLASVGAVILVSYDRLAAAALTSEARITKTAAPKLIICTWILSTILSVPWIFKREYIERQWLNYLETFCAEDVHFLHVYWHIIVTILVWAPIGLMIITYGTIMWRLERSAKKLKIRTNKQCLGKARGKAMRITACVLLGAALCRLPLTILVYWRNNLSGEVNSADGGFAMMWFMGNFLIFVNCAINPLIYGFTNERFRRAMDRTPGVSCFKFGSWCCVCDLVDKKTVQTEEKNTENIFVIESSPRPNKKIFHYIKNILHINKDTLDFSVPKVEELTNKPTRVTPVKAPENI